MASTVPRTDHGGTGELIWSPASTRFGWTSYLGREPVTDTAPEYAVAARRTELSGLPPAWVAPPGPETITPPGTTASPWRRGRRS